MTADPQGLSEAEITLLRGFINLARNREAFVAQGPAMILGAAQRAADLIERLLDAARSEGLRPSAEVRDALRVLVDFVHYGHGPGHTPPDIEWAGAAAGRFQAHPAEQGKDGWQDIETCPREPTDDTWRILAYMPGASRSVAELWRNQSYEEAPWMWSTPAHAGRGSLVFWEAITYWRPLPAAPPLVEGDQTKNRGGSGAEERPSRGSPTDSQMSGGAK